MADRITPLHRGATSSVRPIDPAELRRIFEPRIEAAEWLQREQHKPSTFTKVAEALTAPRMFTFYLGFYAGCMATVGLAYLWSFYL